MQRMQRLYAELPDILKILNMLPASCQPHNLSRSLQAKSDVKFHFRQSTFLLRNDHSRYVTEGCGPATLNSGFTWSRPIAPAGIQSGEKQNCASLITRTVGPRSRSWFEYGVLLSNNTLVFLLYKSLHHGNDPPIDTGGCSAQQLARHREISTSRWLHEILVVSFFHIPSSLDKELIVQPMFSHAGSFCTLNLSSGTALQHDFAIRMAWSKHLMMNILAAVHSA